MLTEYKKVRTPSVHTGHTDLQADLIKASRHGVSTGCALGEGRVKKLSEAHRRH